MASGDTLLVFSALSCDPLGSSDDAALVPNCPSALEFSPSVAQNGYFTAIMPQHYRGGDLEVVLSWLSPANDTAQRCRWAAAIDRCAPDVYINAAGMSFADLVEILAAPSATVSGLRQDTLTIAAGSAADGLEAGDLFRLKVRRVANHASDTLADVARLVAVEMREV